MIFGPCSNLKIAIRVSKRDIGPELNDEIGIQVTKCDIRPEFECQNRISNVKMRYIRPEHVSFNRNMYIAKSQSQN